MGYNELCPRCAGLATATCVTLVALGRRITLPVEQVPEGDKIELSAIEAEFRAAWPAWKILEDESVIDNGGDGKGLLPSGTRIRLHKTLQDLRSEASDRRCHLCRLVAEQVKEWDVDADPARSFVVAFFLFDVQEARCDFRCFPVGGKLQQPLDFSYVEAQFVLYDAIKPALLNGGLVGGVQATTMDRIRSWISDCKEMHPECSRRMGGGTRRHRLPTRLLKIEAQGGEIKVNLVESRDTNMVDGDIEYATLSHCWGPAGLAIKLLESNYDEWQLRVPYESLSRTLREAISVASALGVKYLWVDALCIIQDGGDWFEEAPRMRDVYSGSLVTLAATASKDSSGGLTIQDHQMAPCTVELQLRGSDVDRKRVRFSADDTDPYLDFVSGAPLNSRGWVFQERLLSTRIIHFTETGLCWECPGHLDAETLFNDVPSNQYSDVYGALQKGDWEKLVQEYCETQLTKPEDKLVAFAGVAEAFALQHGIPADDYLAGLWRTRLKSQLMWKLEPRDDIPLGPHRPSVAPSWSWASQTGEVNYWDKEDGDDTDYKEWNPSIEITLATAQSRGQSAFSALQSSCLRLKAVLIEIAAFGKGKMALRDGQSQLTRLSVASDFSTKPDSCPAGLPPTHALPMAYRSTGKKQPLCHRTFQFLALRPADGQKKKFVRVNCWEAYHTGVMPDWWSQGSAVDESLCLQAFGSGVYEIELV